MGGFFLPWDSYGASQTNLLYTTDSKNEVNDKDPKFKVGDYLRISKYKNIFAKRYMPNWSEETFVIKKVKNTYCTMDKCY